MRYSKAHIPTLKESPAEAELASHKLMIRAGMIRKLAAGIYSILPFGLKAIKKVEGIIREEMNKADALEVFLPSVQPSGLWHESGRWLHYGLELLRINDRHNREFCYGPTHEEVITDLVRNDVKSYKQLPVTLYQIQTKFRDEIRPRFGIMRAREFTMKDAYSFDATDEGANDSYLAMIAAYDKIFARCGLDFRSVEADSGAIGGEFSREYMVFADSGENDVVYCASCNYAANREKAQVVFHEVEDEGGNIAPIEEIETPNVRTIDEVAAFFEASPEDCIKCLVYETDTAGLIAVLVRGDRQVNEVKVKNKVGAATIALASDETLSRTLKQAAGFIGPVGLSIPVYADQELAKNVAFIAGANKKDHHLVNVVLSRDAKIAGYGDFRDIETTDACPTCGKKEITISRGIEVGHVFKLGTKYSETMKACFLDQNGREKPFIMGCYGIGVGRTVAAAIEQNHDEKGIVWPKEIAPFQVHLLSLIPKDAALMAASEKLYHELEWERKIETFWDERDETIGKKFKDADLLGLPLQVVFGKLFQSEGKVEIVERKTGEKKVLDPIEAGRYIADYFAP